MSSGPIWLHAVLAVVFAMLTYWLGVRTGRQQEHDKKLGKKRKRT